MWASRFAAQNLYFQLFQRCIVGYYNPSFVSICLVGMRNFEFLPPTMLTVAFSFLGGCGFNL